MGAKISDIVDVTITRETARLARTGFGIPAIFGIHNRFPELYRTYTQLSELVTDGFQTTDPEYIAANRMFSQIPSPDSIVIGRREADTTQEVLVTVDTVADDTDYTATINGTEFRIDSGSSATDQTIATALFTAINLGSEPVTAVDNADGTYTLTADVEGDGFSLLTDSNQSFTQITMMEVTAAVASTLYQIVINGVRFTHLSAASGDTVITIAAALAVAVNAGTQQVTADASAGDGTYLLTSDIESGAFSLMFDTNQDFAAASTATPNGNVATGLAALKVATANWYGLMLTPRSTEAQQEQDALAAASWVASEVRLLVMAFDHADIVANVATDIVSLLQDLNYLNVVCFWFTTGKTKEYPDAALLGRMLPTNPGSATWALQELVGITADDMSSTQRTILRGKYCNFYEEIFNDAGPSTGKSATTSEAKTMAGEYIDVVRGGVHWLGARIGEDILTLMLNVDKVPYTNLGIASIVAVVKKRTDIAESADFKILIPNKTVITAPDIADVLPEDREARLLDSVQFSGVLQGAIQTVNVNGKLKLQE